MCLMHGDANDDGKVSGLDLIEVQRRFGSSLSSTAAPVSVPEPALFALGPALVMLHARGAGRGWNGTRRS